MKLIALACLLLVVLTAVVYVSREGANVPILEGDLGVSISEVDGGVVIENGSSVAATVLVESPEGEQRFELDVGASVTVTGITERINVWVVSL